MLSRASLESNHSVMKRRLQELKQQNDADQASFGRKATPKLFDEPTNVVKSQALKVYEQTKLRRTVLLTQRKQDAGDTAMIIAKRQDRQISVAIRDLAKCPSLPLLVDDPNQDLTGLGESSISGVSLKSNNTLPSLISESNANFNKLDESTSIYKTLVGVRRKVGPQSEGDEEYAKILKEKGLPPPEDPETVLKNKRLGIHKKQTKNAMLVKAFDYTYDASKLLDPTRLLFEAACIYDEIGIVDKAAKNFLKCTIPCDPAAIVDGYDLVEDEGFQRRLERMADSHRVKFLDERKRLRTHLIHAEVERQRLRSLVSRGQLIRLYLLQDDFPSAHEHLTEAFQQTASKAEHAELLCYAHSVLKEYSLKCFGEYSKDQQLVRGSAGPLAEAHLNILHELLEEDARNADVLEWLGRRYAEKCDFDKSFKYYKRAADMRNPVRTTVDHRDAYLTRGDAINETEFQRSINKSEAMRFAMGAEESARELSDRAASGTYAWPEGMHKDSTVILYNPPPQGWVYGLKMQAERQEQLGLSHKLPPRMRRTTEEEGESN